MKEIPLSRCALVAIIDDEDYDYISSWRWCAKKSGATVYAVRSVGSRNIYMDRNILQAQSGQLVDHKNGNGLDNRRSNIRLCSQRQNQWNRQGIHGESHYLGVNWHKQRSKWVAKIRINYKRLHLGLFEREEDAALAYNAAAIKYHGEFARLNVVPCGGL